MSISKKLNEVNVFDVIHSDRFDLGVKLHNGTIAVGASQEQNPVVQYKAGCEPQEDNDELRRVALFLVIDSGPAIDVTILPEKLRDLIKGDTGWELKAIRLINGEIREDSETILVQSHKFATPASIDEVDVIGTGDVGGKTVQEILKREDDIPVQVTLAEGAAKSIASRSTLTGSRPPGRCGLSESRFPRGRARQGGRTPCRRTPA